MAASFGVLGFAVGAGLTSLRTPAGSGDVAQHLVSDFARAEIAGQPFDVASSDRHTVKPWLANRTTVSGTIVDLAPEGFPLVGGRVTIVDRIPTPTLVYRHNEHVVAVTELPLDAKGVRGGTGGIETIDGYHVARWSDANLAYVAVSDMDEKALGEFVEAFRRGGGPATEPPGPDDQLSGGGCRGSASRAGSCAPGICALALQDQKFFRELWNKRSGFEVSLARRRPGKRQSSKMARRVETRASANRVFDTRRSR